MTTTALDLGNLWSTEQRAVVEADPSGLVFVDAPPGTGKTAIACGRVAWLIDQGIEPTNVMMISFTRTAVAEIRNRIEQMAEDVEAARSVKITTLDSQAWHLLYGFSDTDVKDLFGGYGENIERITGKMREREEALVDYFEDVEHVILDEAQDLTGARSRFVVELIRILPATCGVTVFADPAQSIFGFASDDHDIATGESAERLLDVICNGDFKFEQHGLTRIYRTKSRTLLKLFISVRTDLLGEDLDGREKYDALEESIRPLADGNVGYVEKVADLEGNPDALVLYRRRIEAHMASSMLSNAGIEHRVRMSGFPVVVKPWIGAVLSGIPSDELSRTRFEEAWEECANPDVLEGLDPGEAWTLLQQLAGDGRGGVEASRLRSVLARSRPPAEVCQTEVGTRGPIVGTIHASKGREAPDVYLMMPQHDRPSEHTDWEEEARVLYVGATRARDRLFVGNGYKFGSGRLESGRAFRGFWMKGKPSAQVEFGMADDLNLVWPVSEDGAETPGDALALQNFLLELHGKRVPLWARLARPDWRWLIHPSEGDRDLVLGRFNDAMKNDIFEVAKRCERIAGNGVKPRFTVKHLWCVGTRTVTLATEDPRVDRLHAPYCDSGIFLAPVIKGFVLISLNGGRR